MRSRRSTATRSTPRRVCSRSGSRRIPIAASSPWRRRASTSAAKRCATSSASSWCGRERPRRRASGPTTNRSGLTDERIDPKASAFGLAAADYERARPSYPAEAIDVLRRQIGVGPGTRVLDLAAGTGKLTRLLVTTGADVVAVEPVAGMRDQLSEVLPEIEALDGTAEAIPFDDDSLDVVTVAQAFHWFDFDKA